MLSPSPAFVSRTGELILRLDGPSGDLCDPVLPAGDELKKSGDEVGAADPAALLGVPDAFEGVGVLNDFEDLRLLREEVGDDIL